MSKFILLFFAFFQTLGFAMDAGCVSLLRAAERSCLEAQEEARKVLLEACDDPESPLALVSAYLYPGKECREVGHYEDVQAKLAEHLKNDASEFRLLTAKDFADDTAFLPEHGEKLDRNWIFRVRMPELTDHIFFAIVPKDAGLHAYVYGFN